MAPKGKAVRKEHLKAKPPAKTSSATPETAADLDPDVAALLPQLNDSKAQTRIQATFELTKLGEIAVPQLRKMMADKDKTVRQWAATGLKRFGPASAAAVLELQKALRDRVDEVAAMAAMALAAIGPQAASVALPELELLAAKINEPPKETKSGSVTLVRHATAPRCARDAIIAFKGST